MPGRQYSRDWYNEVREGRIPGVSIERKFGRNPSVTNGSWSFISELLLTEWPQDVADTIRVKEGGDPADAAAGDGARAIRFVGLNDSFELDSEDVAMNADGTLASASTVKLFTRIFRAFIIAVGTRGVSNTGIINIETTSGIDVMRITAGEGKSLFAGYTVPITHTAKLISVHQSIDTGSAGKAADVRLRVRNRFDIDTPPFPPTITEGFFDGIAGWSPLNLKSPSELIAPRTDIWFEANGNSGTPGVGLMFELLLTEIPTVEEVA